MGILVGSPFEYKSLRRTAGDFHSSCVLLATTRHHAATIICLSLGASADDTSFGRYLTDSGMLTAHYDEESVKYFKPWSEAAFTQPKLYANMNAQITVRIECEGDSLGKIEGPIDLRFEREKSKDDRYQRTLDGPGRPCLQGRPQDLYRNMQNYRTDPTASFSRLPRVAARHELHRGQSADPQRVQESRRRGIAEDRGSGRGRQNQCQARGQAHPHIGNNLFEAMAKGYHGQRRKASDSPQFVSDGQ